MTESSTKHQSLQTCVSSYSPVPLDSIEDLLTWLAGDSLASPLALQGNEKQAMTPEICGQQRWTLSGQSVRPLCTLRTYMDYSALQWTTEQGDLFTILERYSETWPKAGTMSNGVCWGLTMSEAYTIEKECGFSLPTPRRSRAMEQNLKLESVKNHRQSNLETVIANYFIPTPGANEYKGASRNRYLGSSHYRGAKSSEALRTCKEEPIYLNPLFGEMMMGWPTGATELEPLEMDRFHCAWLQPMKSYLRSLLNNHNDL